MFKNLSICVVVFGAFFGCLKSLFKTDAEKYIENNIVKYCRYAFYEVVMGACIIYISMASDVLIGNHPMLLESVFRSLANVLTVVFILILIVQTVEINRYNQRYKIFRNKFIILAVNFIKRKQGWIYLLYSVITVLLFYVSLSWLLSFFNAVMLTDFKTGLSLLNSTIVSYANYIMMHPQEKAINVISIHKSFVTMIMCAYIMFRFVLIPPVSRVRKIMNVCYVDVYLDNGDKPAYYALKFLNYNNDNYVFEINPYMKHVVIPKHALKRMEVKRNRELSKL